MTAKELIIDFNRLGVRLWEEDGQLRYRAPKGLMTDDHRDRLREHKEAILVTLRQEARTQETIVPDPANRLAPFPLTDVQAAYLMGRRAAFEFGNSPCQLYLEMDLPPVGADAVKAAWHDIVVRHDMLRATFSADGYQSILDTIPELPLPVLDLRGAEDTECERALAEVRERMDHRLYDPAVWPLFSVAVTQLDGSTRIHASIDFLVADYQSIQLLMAELEQGCLNPSRTIPSVDIGFRDYVVWQRSTKDGIRHRLDRQYWWDRLDTMPLAPDLPVIEHSSATPARFRRFEESLDAAATSVMLATAAREQVTISNVLMCAFADVLRQWSRHPNFMLNLTVAGRSPVHPEINRVVGDFTTIVPLAVDTSPSLPFSARVRQLQERVLSDLDHASCTGVEIMRELAVRRGRAQAMLPVVYTSTLFQEVGTTGDGAGLEKANFVYGRSQTPQVWLDCQVALLKDRIIVIWDVREQVFAQETAADMFQAMMLSLRRLATDPAAWNEPNLVGLPPDQESRRRLVNETAAPLRDGLLHDGVIAQCHRTPDSPAIFSADRSLTYGEMLRRANAIARTLRERGTAAEEIVAIMMEKGLEQIVAVLGIMIAGAAYLPLDLHQPRVRREQILAEARVRTVLIQSRSGKEECSGCDLIAVDLLGEADSPGNCPTSAQDSLAYVIYTSGSTGRPKGVMVDHRGAINTIEDINRRFAVGPSDRVLGLAHLGFDLSVYDIFGPLAVGGALVLPAPAGIADPSHWQALVDKHGVTIWNSVPAQLLMLQEYLAAVSEHHVDSLRLALLSGDWIPAHLPDKMREIVPHLNLVSLGGATEASIWSIFYPIIAKTTGWRSIPYGMPLANQSFQVLNDRLEPCPDGVAGELYIGGQGLAMGYLNQPEQTAERFLVHPQSGERLYRTGDFGRYMPDGNIEFLGRADRQIKLNGHRIELDEIEAVISSYPGVSAANIMVDRDTLGTGRIIAFLVAARLTEPAGNPADLVPLPRAEEQNLPRFVAGSEQVNQAAALTIASHFRATVGPDRAWTVSELAGQFGTDRHSRLLRRIVSDLIAHELVAADGPDSYRLLETIEPSQAVQAWSEAERLLTDTGYPANMLSYLRQCAENLPILLSGALDPVQLLFPQGGTSIPEAAFRENPASRHVNAVIADMIELIAGLKQKGRPLRVLEVGAGVAGTSAAVLEALAQHEVDYVFTDISHFYLEAAKERFAGYPGLRFALLDLDKDYREQDFAPNSFDVVIAGDVLHATRDVAASLRRIREMLAPSGWLLFTEMTRDHIAFTASFEFMLPIAAGSNNFSDFRRGRDQTFLSLEEWLAVLRENDMELGFISPRPDTPLTSIGMYAIAAQVKRDRREIDLASLKDYLAERLPPYMLPTRLELIDELPLSQNGKVDQALLKSWGASRGQPRSSPGSTAQSPLEAEIGELWRETLGLPEAPPRDRSLYDMGGDSLVLSRLTGRMRESLPLAQSIHFDRLLRQIMELPTIAAVAAFLEDQSPPESDAASPGTESPLVRLGGDRKKPALVLLHDASGGLERHAALVRGLAPHFNLYGLLFQPGLRPNLDLPAPAGVEKVAERYAQALRESEVEGWHVLGCGLGSILALEMSGLLAASGHPPASLNLIGGDYAGYGIADGLLAEFLFARHIDIDPSRLGFAPEAIHRVVEDQLDRGATILAAGTIADAPTDKVRGLERVLRRSRDKRLEILARAFDERTSPGASKSLMARLELFETLLAVLSSHQPTFYAGNILLAMPPARDSDLPRAFNWSEVEFWKNVCLGTLTVVDSGPEEGRTDRVAAAIAQNGGAA